MRDEAPLVAIVDDDPAVGSAVGRLLTATGCRVRTFTSARGFLDDFGADTPECLLVDVRMPDLDGPSLVRTLRAAGEDVPAVFLTATGDVHTVVDVMKLGAFDLLHKPFTADALIGAVSRASTSGRRMMEERRAVADLWRRFATVTPREAEVCALVSAGLSNKRVAAQIGITEKTVKVHRARVLTKMGASSLAAMVRMVDALVATADRSSVRIDGVDAPRPRSVDIAIEVVRRSPREAAGPRPTVHVRL